MQVPPRHVFDASEPLEMIELHLSISGLAAAVSMANEQQNSYAAIVCREYRDALHYTAFGDLNTEQMIRQWRGQIKAALANPKVRAAMIWGREVAQREDMYNKFGFARSNREDLTKAFEMVYFAAVAEAAEAEPNPDRQFQLAMEYVARDARQFGAQVERIHQHMRFQPWNQTHNVETVRHDFANETDSDEQPPDDDGVRMDMSESDSDGDQPPPPHNPAPAGRGRRPAGRGSPRAKHPGQGRGARRRRLDFDADVPEEMQIDRPDRPERPRGG